MRLLEQLLDAQQEVGRSTEFMPIRVTRWVYAVVIPVGTAASPLIVDPGGRSL